MARFLPPLNALRAFEAAARHLSFTRAAEELNVTQAAISHQIKALEERLDVSLFRRVNRGLRLTDAGQAYLPVLRDAFDAIAQATDRLCADEARGRLTVSALHSFATAWLLPRLPRFRARHPEIDVLLDAEDRLVDFARDQVDMVIRYGAGDWPGLRAEMLMEEEVFPVCSPALLRGPHPPNAPADLARFPLIYDDMRVNWPAWLAAAGVPDLDHKTGIAFTSSFMALEAAIAGQGIALARSTLVADALAQGRLVRLFNLALPARFAYYAAAPAVSWERPKVRAFRDWLRHEVAIIEGRAEPDLPPPTTDQLSGPLKV